jgi:hypothetical protein
MVLLFVPFRNEAADILDRNKFVDIFNQNQEAIITKRKEYEANIDLQRVMNEIKLICDHKDVQRTDVVAEHESLQQEQRRDDNNDDIQSISSFNGISAVRRREGVMPKQKYCEMMRLTNPEQ